MGAVVAERAVATIRAERAVLRAWGRSRKNIGGFVLKYTGRTNFYDPEQYTDDEVQSLFLQKELGIRPSPERARNLDRPVH